MAEHQIIARQPAREVVNNDYIFEIHSDATKLGQLDLSKGGIDWWTHAAKTATSLSWEDLSLLLDAFRADASSMRSTARQILADD